MWKVIAFIAMVLADQISKYLAVEKLAPVGTYEFLPKVLNLTYAENTGAAFSMLQGKTVFLIVLPLAVCLVIGYALVFKREKYIKHPLEEWSLIMILSGALGNIIDRIFRGAVVDFFELKLFEFPIFNVADIFITVGAVLLFVYILFFSNEKEKCNE